MPFQPSNYQKVCQSAVCLSDDQLSTAVVTAKLLCSHSFAGKIFLDREYPSQFHALLAYLSTVSDDRLPMILILLQNEHQAAIAELSLEASEKVSPGYGSFEQDEPSGVFTSAQSLASVDELPAVKNCPQCRFKGSVVYCPHDGEELVTEEEVS